MIVVSNPAVRWSGPSLAAVAVLTAALPATGRAQPVPDSAARVAADACRAGLRSAAVARGIRASTFDSATATVVLDLSVIEARSNQPEFTTPIWDYLALLVDDERVSIGKARLAQWDSLLVGLERSFGVDRHVIVAVWGVESDYGRVLGTRPLVQSLMTGACRGGRRSFFTTQLMATLQIVDRGELPGDLLLGSWAGAFGQTQFMPTTFLERAVDGDGDGRRDIVTSVPDALASAANYLARAGWKPERPWGYEVAVPAKIGLGVGRRQKHPLAAWKRAGVTRIDGGALPATGTAALIEPAGREGPSFLVTRNFDALYSYNAAESYALAIAHLADRLRGAGGFVTPWPTDDRGLSRVERIELQQRLIDRGYDLGTADGVLGPKSRAAIKDFQQQVGLHPDGRGGGKVLDALRAAADSLP